MSHKPTTGATKPADLLSRTYPELTTDELREMTARAYLHAASEWREYQKAKGQGKLFELEVLAMLRDSAQSADDLWRSFAAELARRDAQG